jgi:hypothetical protein
VQEFRSRFGCRSIFGRRDNELLSIKKEAKGLKTKKPPLAKGAASLNVLKIKLYLIGFGCFPGVLKKATIEFGQGHFLFPNEGFKQPGLFV